MTNYYAILGLSTTASAQEIDRAYKRLAKLYHPDMPTADHELFLQIGKAHKILADPNTRQLYDETGITAAEDALLEQALHMIMQFAGSAVLDSDQPVIDIPFVVKKSLQNATVEADYQIEKIDKVLKEIEERWEGAETVKRLLVVNLGNRRESFRKDRLVQDRAVELMKDCRYRRRQYETNDRRTLAGMTMAELFGTL